MRQEIRKRFRGEPRRWDAEVATDDVAGKDALDWINTALEP